MTRGNEVVEMLIHGAETRSCGPRRVVSSLVYGRSGAHGDAPSRRPIGLRAPQNRAQPGPAGPMGRQGSTVGVWTRTAEPPGSSRDEASRCSSTATAPCACERSACFGDWIADSRFSSPTLRTQRSTPHATARHTRSSWRASRDEMPTGRGSKGSRSFAGCTRRSASLRSWRSRGCRASLTDSRQATVGSRRTACDSPGDVTMTRAACRVRASRQPAEGESLRLGGPHHPKSLRDTTLDGGGSTSKMRRSCTASKALHNWPWRWRMSSRASRWPTKADT